MAQLIIENENLAYRLLRLAQEQERSVEAVLDELLRHAEDLEQHEDEEETAGMKLARLAREADLQFTDIPPNVDYDAILKQEMADDLWRRMGRTSDDKNNNGD